MAACGGLAQLQALLQPLRSHGEVHRVEAVYPILHGDPRDALHPAVQYEDINNIENMLLQARPHNGRE